MKELYEKLNQLENKRFMLQMKDGWGHDEFEQDRKYEEEIKELKKQIELMEG